MFYIKNNQKRDLGYMDIFNSLFNSPTNLKANIEEAEDEYVITMEAAGVKKENININIEDDTLTVEITTESKDEDKYYLLKEIKAVNTTRSFYLDKMDDENVKAKLNDGILTIQINKIKEASNSKRIISID